MKHSSFFRNFLVGGMNGECRDAIGNLIDCQTGVILGDSGFNESGIRQNKECRDDVGNIIDCQTGVILENYGYSTSIYDAPIIPKTAKEQISNRENQMSNKKPMEYQNPYIAPISLFNTLLADTSNNVDQRRKDTYYMNNVANPYRGILSYGQEKNTYDVTGKGYENTFKMKKGGYMEEGGYEYDEEDGSEFIQDLLNEPSEDTLGDENNEDVQKKVSEPSVESIEAEDIVKEALNYKGYERRNPYSELEEEGSGTFSPKEETAMYMRHQQGAAGFEKISKAALEGKSSVGYVGKENIDENMRRNVSKDFEGAVTPARFLQYWEDKFSRKKEAALKIPSKYDDIIQKVAKEEGISADLLKTVAYTESGFNADNQRNTKSKYKGLMAVSLGLMKHYGYSDPYDPYQNLKVGAKNLKGK